jgi:hypothetical protein
MTACTLYADDQPSSSLHTSSNHDMDLKETYYLPSTQDFFVYADYLLWKPNYRDTDSLKVFKFSNLGRLEKQVETRINYPRLPYSSGFRVGVGYRFPQNYLSSKVRPWQVEASYERIYTSTDIRASTKGITSYYEKQEEERITLQPNSGEVIRFRDTIIKNTTRGKATNYLGYNRADFKLSWPFWIADNVILKIGPGATFGYLKKRRLEEVRQNASPAGDLAGDYISKSSGSWWGGGLSGFADIHFEIGKGFGFFMDTSAAFMFGITDNKSFESYPDNSTFENTYKNGQYDFQPVVKAAVGLDFKRWFGSVQMYTNAGWEYNYWFYGNLFDLEYLSFSGLTARLGVAF